MKKIFFTLLVVTIMTFTACGRSVATNVIVDETSSIAEEEDLIESENATDFAESTEKRESFETDLSGLSPIDALKKVLLSEAPFYCCTNPGANKDMNFKGYLKELSFSEPIVTPQFAILDLDGDDVPEIVLAIEDYMGFVVLRYHEGKVFGWFLGYRSMHGLKADGSFWQSGSAFESYISKLFFIGNMISFDVNMQRLENAVEISYYLHDVPVDEVEWETYYQTYEEKADAEWHEFSEEAVEKYVVTNSEIIGLDGTLNERQAYLDSFSYLAEMTEVASKDDVEEYNKQAKKYYYSCLAEMNKIYELCKDKLSASELTALEEAQSEWQEGIDLRLAGDLWPDYYSVEEKADWSLYFTYGEMILTRAFHLVNLYYDCHFYD